MRPGVVIADRFELGERIGSGAMGLVFRALDRASGAQVALKLLHSFGSDDDARFQRECELLASIDAPLVVRYVAHGATSEGRPFLAMDWVEGRTLSKVVRERPLDVPSTVEVVAHLATAVATLHQRGIVHRDLKPANVILAHDDLSRPTLVDFGIAFSNKVPDGLTAPGIMIGSPGYMAPEQARGEADIDVRADVFALGCLVFKCLTGNTPFFGDVVTVLLKLAMEECPRLSERATNVPPALDELVGRMLARSRADRPRDAAEVAQAFAELRARDFEARPSQNPPVLTTTEMRVSSIVVGRLRPGSSPGVDPRELVPQLSVELAATGARMNVLADGTIAVTLDEPYASASDLAMRGVRAALALRATFPEVQVVVATGRAADAGRTLVGQVIERASGMLSEVATRGHRGMIVLDATTTHLVESHFVILPWASGGRLIGERAVEAVRELLGKATPCVGRERELAELGEIVHRAARTSTAGAALVVAPAGMGKSRLRAELLARLDPAAFEVWTARGDPMSRRSPFGLVSELVFRAAGIVRGESDEQRWEKLLARVERGSARARASRTGAPPTAADEPPLRALRVAEFLGELSGVARPDQQSLELRAARRDRGLMADQMRRALEDFLAGELADKPLLIVLEDLQWGDLPSLTLLGNVLRQLRGERLFLLGLARPELDPLARDAWPEAQLVRVDLAPLAEPAARRLVRAALGTAPSDAAVDALVARAGGNAFFLEELVRAVAQGRGHSLPETVLATIEARLDELPAETRRVLRAASMFGQWCWEGGIRALVGGRDLRTHLAALVERELLVRHLESRFEGQAEYAFRNAIVAETAYAMIPDEDRARGHAEIARWLVAVKETEPSVLAEHFERGGDGARALSHWVAAAERALGGQDLERAIDLADRGLKHAPVGAVAGRLRGVRAEALLWRGHNAEAASDASLALAELEPGDDDWCAAATTGVTGAGRVGDRALVLVMVERVLSLPRSDERRTAHVVLLSQCAIQMVFAGQLGLVDDLLARLDHREGEGSDPRALAWTYRALAWRAIAAGDPGAYGRLMQRSADHFGQLGDVRNQCVQRVNVAYADLSVGDLERSVAAFVDVIATTTALGIDTVTSVARHNLGYALALVGRLDDAEREERAALDAFVSHGDLRMQGTTHTYLALISLMRGDTRVAVAEGRAALALATQEGPSRAIALATMAAVLLSVSQGLSEALTLSRQAIIMLEELGGVDEGEALIRLTYARCLHANGDGGGAARAIARAAQRLRDRALLIHPEELRAGFLERLPDHALTLSLAEEWVE